MANDNQVQVVDCDGTPLVAGDLVVLLDGATSYKANRGAVYTGWSDGQIATVEKPSNSDFYGDKWFWLKESRPAICSRYLRKVADGPT